LELIDLIFVLGFDDQVGARIADAEQGVALGAEGRGEAHSVGLAQVAGLDADGTGGAGSVAAGKGEFDPLAFGGVEDVAIVGDLNNMLDVALPIEDADGMGSGTAGHGRVGKWRWDSQPRRWVGWGSRFPTGLQMDWLMDWL
jgi:hypothetical protein